MPRVLNKQTDSVPDGAVYVGRPSKWGNPFRLPAQPNAADRALCVDRYREWLMDQPMAFLDEIRRELAGKDLVCWCAPEACHADVLLEVANDPHCHRRWRDDPVTDDQIVRLWALIDGTGEQGSCPTPGPWETVPLPSEPADGFDAATHTPVTTHAIRTAYPHPMFDGKATLTIVSVMSGFSRPFVHVCKADAELIVAAVNALPQLLSELQRQRAALHPGRGRPAATASDPD